MNRPYSRRLGDLVIVATLGRGDTFGDMSVLTGNVRSSDAAADLPTEVIFIEPPASTGSSGVNLKWLPGCSSTSVVSSRAAGDGDLGSVEGCIKGSWLGHSGIEIFQRKGRPLTDIETELIDIAPDRSAIINEVKGYE